MKGQQDDIKRKYKSEKKKEKILTTHGSRTEPPQEEL